MSVLNSVIAIYNTHAQAEAAIKELQRGWRGYEDFVDRRQRHPYR